MFESESDESLWPSLNRSILFFLICPTCSQRPKYSNNFFCKFVQLASQYVEPAAMFVTIEAGKRELEKRKSNSPSFGKQRNREERMNLCGTHSFLFSILKCKEREGENHHFFSYSIYIPPPPPYLRLSLWSLSMVATAAILGLVILGLGRRLYKMKHMTHTLKVPYW